ncbi:hypothetical protein PHLCEN_2v183 [Hermanssonia centrifuga]|uniref:Pyranose 2-oxidase n=1 Tax=Hermanssonia centrifuga TaxID=98765 RepID=A0A2R6S6T0_9APHY|nr:hypothetical protein PHLCEN_2v183 [Hermanssonia centrifuga]
MSRVRSRFPIRSTISKNFRQDKPFLSLSKNPAQDPFLNLGAEAVTRGVGGMTTHWTCATPRLNPYKELPQLVRDPAANEQLWKKLYDEAEHIIGTSTTQFDESIRHNLVLRNLQKLYEGENRVFRPLPLACHRLPDPDYVEWHATDRILEPLFTDPRLSPLFTLLTNHRCTRVNIDPSIPSPNSHTVRCAEVKCLLPEIEGRDANDSTFYVHANAYVIACGAVGTPQILANSQRTIEPKQRNADPKDRIIETPLTPNLGRYITEQPMTFCQVVLDASLINSVDENPWNLPWWAAKVDAHKERFPEDPIHIPFRDPEPQVTTPFTEDHPWHTQIHRDAFSYGAVAETIDTRLIVDFRFFGYTEPRELNQVIFQDSYDDAYGMPQPTFKFQMSDDDRQRARRMMDDMCSMALKLGGYLPGSEPQFMTPGLALHLAGTVRAGLDEKETVADTYCKVWNFDNLYVADELFPSSKLASTGNGVIPTGFGANPTLTSICYAIRSANQIVENVTAALAAKMN